MREVVEYSRTKDESGEPIRTVATPRFAAVCPEPAIKSLRDLERAGALAVQTHVSEDTSECELFARLFSGETMHEEGEARWKWSRVRCWLS